MKSSLVFVTGSGGFIGSHITHFLVQAGYRVRALLAPAENDTNIRNLNVEIVRGDVRDRTRIQLLMKGCTIVIHAAALNTFWHRPKKDFYDINVQGTNNICNAAITERVEHFLFLSSCDVMGSATKTPRNETFSLPHHIAGASERSKSEAEHLVREYGNRGLPLTIFRPTAVIGPNDIYGTPPGRLIRSFLQKKLPFYYDAGINVIDVRDVAQSIVQAIVQKRINETYILGGRNIFLVDLLQELEALTHIKKPKIKIPYHLASLFSLLDELRAFITTKTPYTTHSSVQLVKHPWFFDCKKALSELSLTPRPLAETIHDTVKWHQQHLWN